MGRLSGCRLTDRVSLEESLLAKTPTADRFGIVWVVKSKGPEPPVILKVSVGGEKGGSNFFEVDFSRRSELPSNVFFRTAIERIGPYECTWGRSKTKS